LTCWVLVLFSEIEYEMQHLWYAFSFNMAHCYPDLAGDVDVISDSEV